MKEVQKIKNHKLISITERYYIHIHYRQVTENST